MPAFKWAFIGSGVMAKTAARQLLPSGRHEIVTVHSRQMANAEAFAAKYGGLPCPTLKEAVDRSDVDGVYIATAHPAHYEQGKECLLLQKPLLVEKPFTLNAAQASELFGLAAQQKLFAAEAMWTWYGDVARQVKAWVDGGEVGDIKSITVYSQTPTGRLKMFRRLLDFNAGGGALLDTGVYPLTYCYRLLGMPQKIECEATMQGGVDIGEHIRLGYPGDVYCDVYVSIVSLNMKERAEIVGTKGKITVPLFHFASRAVLKADGKKHVFKGKTNLLQEFDHAAEDIRAGRTASSLVPPQATLDVMKIMDTCREQMGLVYPQELT